MVRNTIHLTPPPPLPHCVRHDPTIEPSDTQVEVFPWVLSSFVELYKGELSLRLKYFMTVQGALSSGTCLNIPGVHQSGKDFKNSLKQISASWAWVPIELRKQTTCPLWNEHPLKNTVYLVLTKQLQHSSQIQQERKLQENESTTARNVIISKINVIVRCNTSVRWVDNFKRVTGNIRAWERVGERMRQS